MAELTDTQALPVLPLATGVVLPEHRRHPDPRDRRGPGGGRRRARRRRPAPARAPHRRALRPRRDRRAVVEESGELPNGLSRRDPPRPAPGRARRRRRRHRDRRCGSRPTTSIDGRPSDRAEELGRELRVGPVRAGRAAPLPPPPRAAAHHDRSPARSPTASARGPTCRPSARSSCSRPSTSRTGSSARSSWARDALAEHEVTEKIRQEVGEGMEKQQREFLLRQQLAGHPQGARRGRRATATRSRSYREQASPRPTLPETVARRSAKEIDKLERTSEQSPEHGWIRTWLDTILELPWGKRSEERLDVTEARAHPRRRPHRSRRREGPHRRVPGGAQAARRARAGRRADDAERGAAVGLILALVGPPGVGKTSLGESVARATGREFVRVALGGVRDEAEIRGHRRTYVGALPGSDRPRLQGGRDDEPGHPARRGRQARRGLAGRPVDVRCSRCSTRRRTTRSATTTSRSTSTSPTCCSSRPRTSLETIPGPLLDRMEVVRLDGYTEDEKVVIARDHLLARQRERNGL